MRELERGKTLEQTSQQLRVLQEKNHATLLDGRVRTYREIIAAGDLNQFALQLAQNPEDAQTVISMLKDDRDENRRQTVEFVTRLVDSGAIERWEVGDQVREALHWMKDATNKVITSPESTRAPSSDPGKRRQGPPELPKLSLPGHSDDAVPQIGQGDTGGNTSS